MDESYTIHIMPDEDGYHWRGVGEEDEAVVNRIMLNGVPGSPQGYDSRPLESVLGGFCYKALREGYKVIVSE